MLIGNDGAPLCQFHTGPFRMKTFRIRPASRGEKNGIAVQRIFLSVLCINRRPFFDFLQTGSRNDGHAIRFQYIFNRFRHIPVFFRQKYRTVLEDRHFASETGIHGSKFQSYISAADNRQPAGQCFILHHGFRREHQTVIFHTGYSRNYRTPAGIDNQFGCGKRLHRTVRAFYPDRFSVKERSRAVDDLHTGINKLIIIGHTECCCQFLFLLHRHMIILTLHFKIMGRRPLRLQHQTLGGNAAHIDACTAVHTGILFNQRHFFALLCQFRRQRLSRLAETDDNRIKFLIHIYSFLSYLFKYLNNTSPPDQDLIYYSLFYPILQIIRRMQRKETRRCVHKQDSLLSSRSIFHPYRAD